MPLERKSSCSLERPSAVREKQTFMGEICAAAVKPEITRVRATKASKDRLIADYIPWGG